MHRVYKAVWIEAAGPVHLNPEVEGQRSAQTLILPTDSSTFPFLLRAWSPLVSWSPGVVMAAPSLAPATGPRSLLRASRSWFSLGLFQAGRVAIHRMSPPNTAMRTPSTFTKTASGGESLYLGSLLRTVAGKGGEMVSFCVFESKRLFTTY